MFKVGQKTNNFSFFPRFPDFVSGKVCFVKRAYKKPRLCEHTKSRGGIDKPLIFQGLNNAPPLAITRSKGGKIVLKSIEKTRLFLIYKNGRV